MRSIYARCGAEATKDRAREHLRARKAADLTQRRSALRLLCPGQRADHIPPHADRRCQFAGIVAHVTEKPAKEEPCRGYQLPADH